MPRTVYYNVSSITAHHREQNFALNLLINPEIDFVMLRRGECSRLANHAAEVLRTSSAAPMGRPRQG
jgi:predicted ribonuclease YlaK